MVERGHITPSRCGTVAVVGRPNVGKSTLLNRILGQHLCITSPKPQTTRHAILGIKTRPEGQILFVDTPGIHQRGNNALNRYLNRAARAALAGTDLALLVVEALRWTDEDNKALEAVASAGVKAIAVINKIDRVPQRPVLLPYLKELSERHDFLHLVPVSATKGEQIERLEQLVIAALPEAEPIFPPDQITDRPERFLAAELLREQLMRRYADELPYATAVEVERFKEEGGRYRIHALIWVERPGQKAIIIGKQGEALKVAATQARLKMEQLFGCPVVLRVWVKVKKSWASDDTALAALGYQE